MCKLLVIFKKLIRNLFKLFNSWATDFNVILLYKETIYIKQAAGSWVNIYGLEDKNDPFRRWIGLDSRWLGIRLQDVLLEFKSLDCYKKWKDIAHYDTDSIVNACLTAPEFNGSYGDDVNREWIFHYGNESVNFDIHLSMDRYAIEK